MTRSVRTIAAALILTVSVAGSIAADRLELANGDVITGTIQRMDSTTIVIETEYGVLEVERSAVDHGEFGQSGEKIAAAGAVTDSLVFAFDFDRSITDSTGVYRAVNNGMRFVADRDDNAESALESDGSGTFLSIAPTDELNLINAFSVAFSVRLENASATQYLFSKWFQATSEAADGKVTVKVSSGSITVYLVADDGTYEWFTARGVLESGVWASVAVTFADGFGLTYVNGVQVASKRFSFDTLLVDASPILVMTALSATDDPYGYYNAVGAIDDLRLYSRALAAQEVERLSGASAE